MATETKTITRPGDACKETDTCEFCRQPMGESWGVLVFTWIGSPPYVYEAIHSACWWARKAGADAATVA